ncbi:MAG TPA: hypothetical protein PK079_09915 [Leptospiraceae bacterium]|nr:hypothetical protein [Leptospiraceae bacterium]HMX31742.1 hypothetical protein [Leptospiraceae bacterium]HMY30548.1 hypothetical protein [Leptospiraceae bacterium]HMZ64151.1 hypothetical protein [Leptospiraceae bacterium]HNA08741.1 hypothetical protein [Leptospiraceae bacterium]
MNLFEIEKKEIESVTIFCDERKNINGQWNYLILLIIPTIQLETALAILTEKRNRIGYNFELKFSDIKKDHGDKFLLASEWIDLIKKDSQKIFHFKILGIDISKFKNKNFGGDVKKGEYSANMYNRFFRTNLLGLKYFFNPLNIDNIFHDTEGNLENHSYFNWHSIWKVNTTEDNITINSKRIYFINSNHNLEAEYSNYSQLIQLSDIVLGSVSNCFDTNMNNIGQQKLSLKIKDLVERIINNPLNKNSSYNYYKRCDISFFPSEPIHEPESSQAKLEGWIYRKRNLVINSSEIKTKIDNQLKFKME